MLGLSQRENRDFEEKTRFLENECYKMLAGEEKLLLAELETERERLFFAGRDDDEAAVMV